MDIIAPAANTSAASVALPAAWSAAINDWTDHLRMRGLAASTVSLRASHLRFIARTCDTTSPSQLRAEHLIALMARREWSAEHRKGLRASFVSFAAHAAERGIIDADALNWLPRVKVSSGTPRPASDAAWERLQCTATPRELLMARLAGEAGLRRAEVAACHRDDLLESPAGAALLVRGKGGRQRVVPITATLADAIRANGNDGYLFPGRTNGHLSPNHVGTLISNLIGPGFTMHTLRHRYATRGYNGTGNLRAVQEALGHASVATTQRYTAVTSHDVRAVSEAAAASLAQP